MQHRRSQVLSPFLVQQEKIGDEEDENEAEALSISDQRTLYLVNIFVANATKFLNSFSALCQDKLSLVHRKILKLDASLTLLESQLRGVQEEPSGMSEASRQPTDNAVISKDKSLVPDELPDVACSSSEPSRLGTLLKVPSEFETDCSHDIVVQDIEFVPVSECEGTIIY